MMTTQAGMIGTNRCIMRISQLIQTTHFSNPTKVTPLLQDVQGLGCPRGQNKCRFGPDLPGIAGREVGRAASGFGPTVGLMPTQKLSNSAAVYVPAMQIVRRWNQDDDRHSADALSSGPDSRRRCMLQLFDTDSDTAV